MVNNLEEEVRIGNPSLEKVRELGDRLEHEYKELFKKTKTNVSVAPALESGYYLTLRCYNEPEKLKQLSNPYHGVPLRVVHMPALMTPRD